MARLRPQEPGGKDGRRIGHGAFERQGAPMLEHDDDGLADLGDGLRQILLWLWNDDLGARLGLARHVGRFADREDDDIGLLRRGDRLGDPARERLLDSRTFGDDDAVLVGDGGADSG